MKKTTIYCHTAKDGSTAIRMMAGGVRDGGNARTLITNIMRLRREKGEGVFILGTSILGGNDRLG